MNHWIFVIRDNTIVFNKRIERKKWPLFRSTKFRTYLEIGDDILFYKAGQHGQRFLGIAILQSHGKQTSDNMVYDVDIKKIKIWKKQPSIRNLIQDLRFIKNKKHWGLHLQGGILKIDEIDYFTILKEVKKMKQRK